MYLLQQLLRAFGSHNIDHRLRHTDFSQQSGMSLYPSLGCSISDLESMNAVLLLGSNIQREQPLASLRLRKTVMNGGDVMRINITDDACNFELTHNVCGGVDQFYPNILGVLKALADQSPDRIDDKVTSIMKNVTVDETHQAIAQQLLQATQGCVLLGAMASQHPQASAIMAAAQWIAKLSNITCGVLTEGANSAGAWLAGAIPHRLPGGADILQPGLHAQAMLDDPRRVYVLLGVEPEHDLAHTMAARQALDQAEFVVCMTPFGSGAHTEYADVILPIAPFAQTDGTFVNATGEWQSFNAAGAPFAEMRPGWKVLRVLANLLGVAGFDYECSTEIRDQLQAKCEDVVQNSSLSITEPTANSTELTCVRYWPMVCVDAVVRRAESLQATLTSRDRGLLLHPNTAEQLHLTDGERALAHQGDFECTMTVFVDERVAVGCVLMPAGVASTAGFGASFEAISLERGEHHG